MNAHIAECAVCKSTLETRVAFQALDAVCCEEKEVA
jgi:hypothetical protein